MDTFGLIIGIILLWIGGFLCGVNYTKSEIEQQCCNKKIECVVKSIPKEK